LLLLAAACCCLLLLAAACCCLLLLAAACCCLLLLTLPLPLTLPLTLTLLLTLTLPLTLTTQGKSGGSFLQQILIGMTGSLQASTPYLGGFLGVIIVMWINAANRCVNALFFGYNLVIIRTKS
jgi:hypothetical protein